MNQPPKKLRPKLLTWICIGSASFGVSWILMLLVMIIYSLKGNIPEGLFPGIAIEYLLAGYLFMFAEILLTAVGIAAIVLMWQMKKTGLYLYAIIKIMIYFLPVLIINSSHLRFLPLLLTSILIMTYGIVFSGNRNVF